MSRDTAERRRSQLPEQGATRRTAGEPRRALAVRATETSRQRPRRCPRPPPTLRPPASPPRASPDLPPVARRFCRYARVWTTSDPASDTFPSTERQKDLGRLLVDELRQAGAPSAEMDEHGYVYATLPSPLPPDEAARLPVLGLVAHLDTSPDAPGRDVRPLVHAAYGGGTVALPGGVALDPGRQPALREHVGHDLITE